MGCCGWRQDDDRPVWPTPAPRPQALRGERRPPSNRDGFNNRDGSGDRDGSGETVDDETAGGIQPPANSDPGQ